MGEMHRLVKPPCREAPNPRAKRQGGFPKHAQSQWSLQETGAHCGVERAGDSAPRGQQKPHPRGRRKHSGGLSAGR